MKKKRRLLNSFTVGFILTILSFFIYRQEFPLFHLLELKSYDVKVRARGTRPISGNVVIVTVDEKSLKEQGRWPWPRTLLARLVDKISDAGAAVIGFDMLFPEKDRYVPFKTVEESIRGKELANLDRDNLIKWLKEASDSDARFAESIERSNRTVLGYFVYASKKAAKELGTPLDATQREILSFSEYSVVQRSDQEDPVSFRPMYGMGISIAELINAANSMGFTSFIPEVDGVLRWIPMVMEHEGILYPPLSLQMLQIATRQPLAVQIAEYGVDRVRVGEIEIPTSENGDYVINYYGPGRTFKHISATDVLTGKVGAEALEGKVVLVGGTAAGIHDLHTSPYGPLYPGVEVHATVMENIISGDFLIRPEWMVMVDLCMIVASGLLLGLLSLYFKALTTAILLCLGLTGYVAFDFYLFTQKGLWINLVYPLFTQLFVYSGITLFKFAFEEREKRFIKGAFSQYLAPAVVSRLVDNPSLLKLGGERKTLTAFFSDVAGFSTISEKLTPGELVELLNAYLTEMTDIIMKYEGTVDKFEGDAIIAFFGAPISYEDHAKKACFVSLEMQERLARLREQWKNEGKHELFMRIGLNTGPMVVGNMGSRSRMDYTMMGDSVNLAARLEGVNKQYGTFTMISEFTYEPARDFVEVRELDLIRVVGKSEPVKIYELLGKKGEIDAGIREISPFYNKGLEHYKVREWGRAIENFDKALEIDVNDGPSLTYFERCILFKGMPPPKEWDGVFGMTSK